MSTLFDTGESPVVLASPEQVRELVDRFAMRKDLVARFTRQKAATLLTRLRKEKFSDLDNGAARAAEQQADEAPGPNARELTARLDAAEALGQDLAGPDPGALFLTVVHAVYALAGGEVVMVARLIKQELELHPVTREPLAGHSEPVEATT